MELENNNHENAGICFFNTHCTDSKEAHHHKKNDTHNHEHEGKTAGTATV